MSTSRPLSLLFALLMTAGNAASQPNEGGAGVQGAAQGESLSYRDVYRAMVVFEKYGKPKHLIQQHLQVMPRDRQVATDGLELTLSGKASRLQLALDATGRAVFPYSKVAYDDNAALLLNRKAGLYQFRPRISIALRPDGIYELADLRAACEQALAYLKLQGAPRAGKCVGVRFSFARRSLDTEVRLRRAEGEGVLLAVADGAAFQDDPNERFRVVNYRFGDAEGGQLVARQAPLALAPLTE